MSEVKKKNSKQKKARKIINKIINIFKEEGYTYFEAQRIIRTTYSILDRAAMNKKI